MRILHITETSVFNFDGISTYINQLVACSHQNGDDVLVLSTRPYSIHVRRSEINNHEIITFPSIKMPGRPKCVIIFPKNFKKVIKTYQPDIVWIHTIGTLGMKAAKFCHGKYKTIYTKHCFDGLMWNTYLKIPKIIHGPLNYLANFCENTILKNVDTAIYHLSEKTKIVKNKYFDKFIFIAPPLPVKFFAPIATKNSECNKLTFGFCGRCDPDKGLDEAFAGLRLFHEKYPDIELEFILIGDGPEVPRLLQENKFLKITVTGYVDDVIPYYDKLDGYILTSKHEMIALSSLEALARGLEVFSLPLGYLKERAGNIPGFHMFNHYSELTDLIFKTLVQNKSGSMHADSSRPLNNILISYSELYRKISYPTFEVLAKKEVIELV